jgi:hypothetical protein
MEAEKCVRCDRELVFASDREMLMWDMSNDPRGDAVAHICPECEDFYCKSCMVDTGRSCPACGAEVSNAGSP